MVTSADIINLMATGKGTSFIINTVTNPEIGQKITELNNRLVQLENSITRTRPFGSDEERIRWIAYETPIKQEIVEIKLELEKLQEQIYNTRPKCGIVNLQLIDDIDNRLTGYKSSIASAQNIISSSSDYYDRINTSGTATQYSAGHLSVSLRMGAQQQYNQASSDFDKLSTIRTELKQVYNNCQTTQQIIQDKPVESAISIGGGLVPLAIISGLFLLSRGKK